MPRSLRSKSHKIESAYHKLEQELGRTVTEAEVAKEMELELPAFQKMLADVSGTVMLSLEELGYGHGEERFKANESLPSTCLLYTSPSPRDATLSRMPSSA